jgi:hypothetical protein
MQQRITGTARTSLFAPRGIAQAKRSLRRLEPIVLQVGRSVAFAKTRDGRRIPIARAALRRLVKAGYIRPSAKTVPNKIVFSHTDRAVYLFDLDRVANIRRGLVDATPDQMEYYQAHVSRNPHAKLAHDIMVIGLLMRAVRVFASY